MGRNTTESTTPVLSDAAGSVSGRGWAWVAGFSALGAVLVFLALDPAAPMTVLNERGLARDWKSDRGRAERVLEEYDYILADPWGLGVSEEQREDVLQRREHVEAIVERMEGRRP